MKRLLFSGSKLLLGMMILLAMFLIVMAWANYRSQVDLRDASMRQFSGYVSQEAAGLNQFFSERQNDLVDLATNREFPAYFENKALGMSREYGLWASQVAISELFQRFLASKVFQERLIYGKVAFVDSQGNVLAASTGVPDESYRCGATARPEFRPDVPCLFPVEEEGMVNLVMTFPFYFGGEFVGTIVARLNTVEILTQLMLHTEDSPWGVRNYLLHGDRVLSSAQEFPEGLLQDLPRSGHEELVQQEYALGGNGVEQYIVSRQPVGETSLNLISLALKEELVGSLEPWQLLVGSVLLAVLLLGGSGILLNMRSENLILNARIAEAAKLSRSIEEKNILLQGEVAARKNVEKVLQITNDELEERVEARTNDLKERSRELAREIVERREAESAMRLIFNNTHDAIVIHDIDGNLLEVNERMFEFFQIERKDLPRLSYPEDFSGPDNPFGLLRRRWLKVLEGEETVFEWTAARPHDGYLFDVEMALNRIELGGREVILANMHDIGEQKRIHQQQEEHREFLNTIFEGIGAAIFVFDPIQGVMVDCNAVGEDLLSLSKEEILAASCHRDFPFVAHEKKDLLCPDWNDQDTFEEGVLSIPGRTPFSISRQLFEISIGGRTHLVQVVFNITERKNLERKLSIAQKLESIGLLASGIAHEINTPIQYVGDSVRFIREAFDDLAALVDMYVDALARGEDGKEARMAHIHDQEEEVDLEFIRTEVPRACNRALEGVQRVATIVLAMKNFSHPGEEKVKAVDINNAIENTITVTRNEWKYSSDLETDLDPELPLVTCIPGGINQVLLNVIVNAVHAIEATERQGGKGKITITTEHVPPFVEIRVQDTGCGIAEDHLEKVFDPFFTTKEVGKGTGQGLAIVHDIIVEKHGGMIDVHSTEGVGTTFILRLPAEE